MAANLTVTIGDGFFIAATSITKKKLKLRVLQDKKIVATYDFVNRGGEILPFQNGSGKYTIELYVNVLSNRYTKVTSQTFNVLLSREDAAFLHTNQYVKYTDNLSNKAIELRKDREDKEFYDAVKAYMKKNFRYDFIYAIQVPKTGVVLPNPERLEKKKMGICQDLAAYAAGLLREGGIPAKLAIGHVDGNKYHAWVITEYGIYDPTAEVNGIARPKKYVAERYY